MDLLADPEEGGVEARGVEARFVRVGEEFAAVMVGELETPAEFKAVALD